MSTYLGLSIAAVLMFVALMLTLTRGISGRIGTMRLFMAIGFGSPIVLAVASIVFSLGQPLTADVAFSRLLSGIAIILTGIVAQAYVSLILSAYRRRKQT